MGSRAFDMLVALVQRQGQVVSRRELMAAAWSGLSVEDSNVRVQMAHLRRDLGCGVNGERYIASVAGRGYCFVAQVDVREPFELTAALANPPLAEEKPVASNVGRNPTERQTSSRLPIRQKKALGRDESLTELIASVEERRLVTVVGPGGVGKTTLALLLAESNDSFDAVQFVDLGVIDDGALVVGLVASTLGVRVPSNEPIRDIVSRLETQRSLLILDNCEHVIDATARLIDSVLERSPSTHILATSIEALRIAGEAVYLLRPLGTPPNTGRLTAKHALAWPSVELFMQRAADGGHVAALLDEQAASVAAICRRLDGNPLAIELVASRVAIYGLEGIADLLDKQVVLRWRGDRNAVARHQTVEALLDWSYVLLSPTSQTVLDRLSVFAGEFSLESAATIVCDDDIDVADIAEAVGDLVDKSMLTSLIGSPNTAHLRLRDTVRSYAVAKLSMSSDADQVRRRHAVYFLNYLKMSCLESDGGSSLREADLGGVRAALEWAFSDTGDLRLAAEICSFSVAPLLNLFQLEECRKWCKRALATLPSELDGSELQLSLIEGLAIASYFGGKNDGEVEEAIRRGLELSYSLGDHRREMHFLAGLSLICLDAANFRCCLESSERFASKAAMVGGAREMATAGWMLGTAHHLMGDQAAAESTYATSFNIASTFQPAGLGYFEAYHKLMAKIAKARVAWLRGSPELALKQAEGVINESSDDAASLCISLLLGTPMFLFSGQLRKADSFISELNELTSRAQLAAYHEAGLTLRGQLMLMSGDIAASVGILRSMLQPIRSSRFNSLVFCTLRALAEGLVELGEHDEAIAVLEMALAQSEKSGGTYLLPEFMRLKAQVLSSRLRPDYRSAEKLLHEASDLASRNSSLAWELRISISRLRLQESQGRRTDPHNVDHLRQIVNRFDRGFETPDLRAAALYLRALPSEAIAS
ncbi:winged helix-turn-helix domain-containing protein [Rhizobium johnstonii]|uniref:ATP-binding protein n=1 Tax=Rhizobium TaxID=379 RepID=UPI002484CD44|nr:winged helix-turn-helix domain-containing protein [Rhizobium leguminosarum]